MPVRPLPYDDVVSELRAEGLAWLGEGVAWFDAHTHIGHHDPDGYEADPEELIDTLDLAGQQKALVFAMQEPDGYRGPNDRVLRARAESGGRLDEARRCLDAGARGFKLRRRATTPARG